MTDSSDWYPDEVRKSDRNQALADAKKRRDWATVRSIREEIAAEMSDDELEEAIRSRRGRPAGVLKAELERRRTQD